MRSVLAAAAVCASCLVASSPADARMLSEGDSGPDVTHLQSALGQSADGQFGDSTHQQVVDYQRQNGLLVDGIVGPQTKGSLYGSHSHSTSSTSVVEVSYSSSSGYSIPSYIVQCESQGNYHAYNSSSGAGGAYQIEPGTWHAYGGTGEPQSASKSEQDAVAARIWASKGSSAWSCAR